MAKAHFETLFSAQDAGFVEALRKVRDMPLLAEFTGRWIADGRAWAHEQMFRYLDLPWDAWGHNPVIKRLFKWAEAEQNDELMAAFATGCDRLARRERRRRWKYDWKTSTGYEETVLSSPRDLRLFSYHTRYYLRRRAWRYFRWMGYRRPKDYPLAVARFLILYRDADLAQGENLLDSWSLMQACFREHPALEFGSSLIRIRPGHSLGELKPAPSFPELWKQPDSADVLLLMVLEARSKAMRTWAIEMLREHHASRLQKLPADELLDLLTHRQEDVQQFAAELLEQAQGLETWPLSTWMMLLETENLTALETICRVMAEKVSGERLTLADCVRLTTSEPTPVARMGLTFLKKRSIQTAGDRAALVELSEAQSSAIAAEVATWRLRFWDEPTFMTAIRCCRFSIRSPRRFAPRLGRGCLMKTNPPTRRRSAIRCFGAGFWKRRSTTFGSN